MVSKNHEITLKTKAEIADRLLKTSEELKMTKITLAVTGSIAAYKAADLTSLLTKEGHDVTVLMTKALLSSSLL